jgi:hypothetical protein
LQAPRIETRPRYPVKMYFPPLAVRTRTLNQCVSAHVPPAAGAVIRPRTRQKLPPALLAHAPVALANTPLAVDTHRRPEKMIQSS